MRHEYTVGRDGVVTRHHDDPARTDAGASPQSWSYGQSGVLHGWRAVLAQLAWWRPAHNALAV
jgi:hypothetical protein